MLRHAIRSVQLDKAIRVGESGYDQIGLCMLTVGMMLQASWSHWDSMCEENDVISLISEQDDF